MAATGLSAADREYFAAIEQKAQLGRDEVKALLQDVLRGIAGMSLRVEKIESNILAKIQDPPRS
jgi:hypothetical protein